MRKCDENQRMHIAEMGASAGCAADSFLLSACIHIPAFTTQCQASCPRTGNLVTKHTAFPYSKKAMLLRREAIKQNSCFVIRPFNVLIESGEI